MGDGGLMDGDDLFGVFLPSNEWHCYILQTAVWAAKELGLDGIEKEAESYYGDALACTLDAMERGAIAEPDGSRWIPGVPDKTCGSKFSATCAIYPHRIIDPHGELANGTMGKLTDVLSPGGVPVGMGWMKEGCWVATAIDTISYAAMERGENDLAASFLYPTLNHGTPLFSWCEERMPEPGTEVTSGDRQHTWTPLSVNRFVRDSLIMEDGDTLHICRASQRHWLMDGKRIAVRNANTHWGKVDFSLERNGDKVGFELTFNEAAKPPAADEKKRPGKVVLYIRTLENETIHEFYSNPYANSQIPRVSFNCP